MSIRRIPVLVIWLSAICNSFPVMAEITMGVFPRRPKVTTQKIFKPLAEKLSEELGEPVKLVVSKNFRNFWKGIEYQEYDLVHFNQYHYLLSHKNYGYRVIAVNEEFGSDKISGSLSVRKDSAISKVTDLRGKTILFGGGKKAMGSYIAPTAILKKAGLTEGKDYSVKFSKNPPAAVFGVFNNAADAAGAGNVIFKVKGVQKKIDISQMKVLAVGEPFIQLPWAVKADMSIEKMKKIQSVLISLKGTDDEILKSSRVTNFLRASDKDFNKVRGMVRYSLGESL